MAKMCACTVPDNVLNLVLTLGGKEQGKTVVARVCPGCGKHYMAPISSLSFLFTRIKELVLETKAPEFAGMVEGYLREIPQKEEK